VPTSAGLRFRVLRPHARGGLGQVSVALDQELRRQVALKEIQEQYAHDPGSRARFLREAEVTGGLEHPGVVPVYGLGCYADGRPFYAMRFIQGDSLQEASARFHRADGPGRDPGERALALRDLLGGLVAVCQAVAYAHSRGVLHRDLKPANVMLGPYGETLVVDWGLAKLVGPPGEDRASAEEAQQTPGLTESAPTQLGVVLGTPTFMAPEQAAGRPDRLGPAADVYSLGATLYCLLTGRAPFEHGDPAEILRRVQAGDFPPPRAHKRGVPRALEAVCLKAMALRPEDRYGGAAELAQEVQRWLADEPVRAYPEPLLRRAARWARRHRAAVASAAVLLLSALAALAVGLLAVNAERRRTQEALELAVTRERQAAAVAALLESTFRGLNPKEEAQDLKEQLANRLDVAEGGLDKEYAAEPLVRARLRHALGVARLGLGEPARAVALFEEALAERRQRLPADDPDTLTTLHYLGGAYLEAGKPDRAVPLLEQAVAQLEARLGPDHPDTVDCLADLGEGYRLAGQPGRAVALLQEALARQKASLGPDHAGTLTTMNILANAYTDSQQLDRALPLYEEVLARRKATLGPDHFDTLISMNNLAEAYQRARQRGRALPLFQEAWSRQKARLGPDHPATLTTMSNLGMAHLAAGHPDEAVPLLEQAVARSKVRLGPEHPSTLLYTVNLGSTYQAAGRLDQAEPLLRATLARRRQQNPESVDTASALVILGLNLLGQKKYAEAEPVLNECLAIRRKKLPDDWSTFNTQSLVGGALLGQKKYAEAEPLLLSGYEGMKKREASIPLVGLPRLTEALERLVQLYEATGQKAEAARWRRRLEEARAAAKKPGP
jgi:tetratricopeptide (TPR) repeat protein